MSRSYKHNPFITDRHGNNIRRRFMKRYSNKSLRNRLKNNDELLNGNSYRKYFRSLMFADHKDYWLKKDAIDTYKNRYGKEIYLQTPNQWFNKQYPTLESYLDYYKSEVIYK